MRIELDEREGQDEQFAEIVIHENGKLSLFVSSSSGYDGGNVDLDRIIAILKERGLL